MSQAQAVAVETDDGDAARAARGSSFYTAMRIMPPPQRHAMYAIYRFCRAVDDIADDDGDVKARLGKLRGWRRDIERIYEGAASPSHAGLAAAMLNFSLCKDDFFAVIDGMEMDVRGPIRAPDMATLDLYCDRVASAVGRLSVRVFGLSEEDGVLLSHHLGRALQLTNILRDLDEDAAIGRLYLPAELLHAAGIMVGDPAQAVAHPSIADACLPLAEKALGHFLEADAVMKRYGRKQVRTPRVMSEAYRAIHRALIERGFAPPRLPVRLSKTKIGFILLRNML